MSEFVEQQIQILSLPKLGDIQLYGADPVYLDQFQKKLNELLSKGYKDEKGNILQPPEDIVGYFTNLGANGLSQPLSHLMKNAFNQFIGSYDLAIQSPDEYLENYSKDCMTNLYNFSELTHRLLQGHKEYLDEGDVTNVYDILRDLSKSTNTREIYIGGIRINPFDEELKDSEVTNLIKDLTPKQLIHTLELIYNGCKVGEKQSGKPVKIFVELGYTDDGRYQTLNVRTTGGTLISSSNINRLSDIPAKIKAINEVGYKVKADNGNGTAMLANDADHLIIRQGKGDLVQDTIIISSTNNQYEPSHEVRYEYHKQVVSEDQKEQPDAEHFVEFTSYWPI